MTVLDLSTVYFEILADLWTDEHVLIVVLRLIAVMYVDDVSQ